MIRIHTLSWPSLSGSANGVGEVGFPNSWQWIHTGCLHLLEQPFCSRRLAHLDETHPHFQDWYFPCTNQYNIIIQEKIKGIVSFLRALLTRMLGSRHPGSPWIQTLNFQDLIELFEASFCTEENIGITLWTPLLFTAQFLRLLFLRGTLEKVRIYPAVTQIIQRQKSDKGWWWQERVQTIEEENRIRSI